MSSAKRLIMVSKGEKKLEIHAFLHNGEFVEAFSSIPTALSHAICSHIPKRISTVSQYRLWEIKSQSNSYRGQNQWL